MAKKKSSFLRNLQRSRKTTSKTLRVESLESRQLYASISGAGQEVVTDQTNSDGVTYDQILMTGSSVSVTNDAGQVTRVSFLDNDGDIVQVALIGNGTLNVSLDNPVTNVTPSNYNAAAQAYSYVQGNATITITGSDANTSMEVYSVGAARNPGVVDATHQGGDHWADISRIIIVGNEKNEAGYTNFGSIKAGNAYFSADTGVVGIRAENVAVQGVVRIGDIDATGSGVPTLYFNSNSQFQNVFVQGGDLKQSNGTSFDSFGNGNAGGTGNDSSAGGVSLGGFAYFNSITGMDSQGNYLLATPVNQDAIRLAAVEQQTLMTGDWVFTLDATGHVTSALQDGVNMTSALLGGATTAQGTLDAAFALRTFTGDITINGDLPAGLEINVADARGDVTFANDLFGRFVVDGFGASIDGTLTVMGNLDGTVLVRGVDRVTGGSDAITNSIAGIVVGGNTGAFTNVRAEQIGNIAITGNFSGIISTDVNGNNAWNGNLRTGTTYTDVDGTIGNVTVGQKADGTSNGGSIINGTIQGMSGIGNVWVGGDVWGSPVNSGVFVTSSNPGAASTDVRSYGTANIGTITVHGDVDLDTASSRLIYINGNGTFGDINVEGALTVDMVPGAYINTTEEAVIDMTDLSFVRILTIKEASGGFTPDAAAGEVLQYNVDINGSEIGGLDYQVTAQDLVDNPALKVYDLGTGAMRAAVVGDKVPVLSGGSPVVDSFGNVVYTQYTALYQGRVDMVPTDHYGPDTYAILSGNRGNLDGVANNFGRIEITGLLGAQQYETGSITWNDSVDMNFGGVTVNSAGTQNNSVIGTVGTIGQITITNDGLGVQKVVQTGTNDQGTPADPSDDTPIFGVVAQNLNGEKADLNVSGTVGAATWSPASTNAATAMIGLEGVSIEGFEDVAVNGRIRATEIQDGIEITTIAGSATASPSVTFNNMIVLNNGSAESAQDGLLLSINTGMVNSQIVFADDSGILVSSGVTGDNTGDDNAIGDLNLAADYVYFGGSLSARTIGDITITGGVGINSVYGDDTAVDFFGARIYADTVGDINVSATVGDIYFNPTVIQASSDQVEFATVGDINISTAGSNSGGDIYFGNSDSLNLVVLTGVPYAANFGNITLTTGYQLFLDEAGQIRDNEGNINLGLETTGSIGNLTASTVIGTIDNNLWVLGNAGNITYTAGVAVVADADMYAGAVGDLVQVGNISATQFIAGTRGATTMTTAGHDGTTVDFTIGGVDYSILPAGTINANVAYAGTSTAATAFIAKTGAGAATVNYMVTGYDDNDNGVLTSAELGHGGSAEVSSVEGNITFDATTDNFYGWTKDYIHFNTLGDVTLSTGAAGSIGMSFTGLGKDADFDGVVGNISATTEQGAVNLNQSTFANSVGTIALESTAGGNVGASAVFNGNRDAISLTTHGEGDITASIESNGKTTATGASFTFSSEQGDQTISLLAGSFDANDNGLTTANEYAAVGNIVASAKGGNIALTLGNGATEGVAYTSDLEKATFGDITITNSSYVSEKLGMADAIAAGGNITIDGGSFDGLVGNIAASLVTEHTADTASDYAGYGTITVQGTFGDVGKIDLSTDSYNDPDTVVNKADEAPVFQQAGVIVFNTTIERKHDTISAETVENGTVSGSIAFGGTSTSDLGLDVNTVMGNQTLTLKTNGAGQSGDIALTSVAGDIALTLDTDSVPGNSALNNNQTAGVFGAITIETGDAYKGYFGDTVVRGYFNPSEVKADAVEATPFSGDITITGAATNLGTVESITADTIRGDITLKGTFFNLGDVALTTTARQDATTNGGKAVVNADAGDIVFGGAGANALIINGVHGTSTLKTYVDVQSDSTDGSKAGLVSGGTITGNVVYGGTAKNANSIVASTGSSNITLDVEAKWFDLDDSGLITDVVNQVIQGVYSDEFAHVGNIVLTSDAKSGMLDAEAGDITLGIATGTANNSTKGSSIGDITATTTTVVVGAAKDKAADVINAGDITVIGKSTTFSAGKVGDIDITLDTGVATLTGNFHDIGAVEITTGLYNDSSANAAGTAAVLDAGDIKLGSAGAAYGAATDADTAGFTTLNIAGTYDNSSVTVKEMGTITGSVYIAGTTAANWTLTADYGLLDNNGTASDRTDDTYSAIDVGFVAGFDANSAGGKIGNITASSTNYGNVTIAVGGRVANAEIGDVSVSTGDDIVQTATKLDSDYSYYGTATITGISGDGLGKVGNLTNSVKAGAAWLNGTFGGIGNATFTTDVAIDLDPTATATENRIIASAGDIFLDAAILGSHGTLNLTTVDTSKVNTIASVLPLVAPQTTVPTLDKVAGLGDTGVIMGTVVFGGGLNSGVTDGIVAKSDRGAIGLAVGSGDLTDKTVAGKSGNVSLTSIDGSVMASLNVLNNASSIGNVLAKTGATYQTMDGASDATGFSKVGDVTITSFDMGNNSNYGTVGNVSVETTAGDINFSGNYNNLGTVTLDAGYVADADNAMGLGEEPIVIAAGKIDVTTSARGTHGGFILDTDDAATITSDITVYGKLAAGTNSLVATTDTGLITSTFTAGDYEMVAEVGLDIAAGAAGKNADNFVGEAGNISLTSVNGDIVSTNNTSLVSAGTDADRYGKIGNITATTGSTYSEENKAVDTATAVDIGTVSFDGTSNGIIGDIAGTTEDGNITFEGTYNHTVGKITLTAGQVIDTSYNAAGADVVIAAGDITFDAIFGSTASTTIKEITLTATGVYDDTMTYTPTETVAKVTGDIDFTADFGGLWDDANTNGKIDSGELITVAATSIDATVTDGEIEFTANNNIAVLTDVGFGAVLQNVTLTSEGSSETGTTGDILVDGKGAFGKIENIEVTTGSGDVTYDATWGTTTAKNITLTSLAGNGTGEGDVVFSGDLAMAFADATNNRTTSTSISDITLEAVNGNVSVSGTITTQLGLQLNGNAEVSATLLDKASAETRTFEISNITLKAGNDGPDNGAADGVVTISGLIGSNNTTKISDLSFTAGSNVNTDMIAVSGEIFAHNIDGVVFNGYAQLDVASIVADDSNTDLKFVGGVNYEIASVAATPGTGSVLNSITGLVFNGSVSGTGDLQGAADADIIASKIGDIVVNANVDPTTTINFAVSGLNVRATAMGGELVAVDETDADDTGYNTIEAFSMGNILITHNLTAASTGTSVFTGNSTFLALGAMGDIRIDSVISGSIQAPLFSNAANDSAWFVVGDPNANLAVVGAANWTGVTTNDALPSGKLVVGDGVSGTYKGVTIADVYVNAGSSYTPPAAQNEDIGGIGGAGGGFAVAVGVQVGADLHFGIDTGATTVTAIDNVAGARDLYGYIKTVEFTNAAIRPDQTDGDDSLTGALPAGTTTGAVVVAGDGVGATDDIYDVVNDVDTIAPATAIIGLAEDDSDLIADLAPADDNDLVVYVL